MSARGEYLLERLRPILATRHTPVYLVGGAVRDALLGQPAYDLDFVVAQDAISLAFTVGDALRVAAYVLDRERDIARVVVTPQVVLDFARFRGPSLEADLRARDFTINALAINVAEDRVPQPGSGSDASSFAPPALDEAAIIDPCGGLADLHDRILRLTHPGAIDDDPLRALRAVRLSCQLGFDVTAQTADAARRAAPRLGEMSAERLRDELLKIVRGPAPHRALQQMSDLALLPPALPEMDALRDVQQSAPHREPALAHTVSVLQRLLQVEQALLIQPGPEQDDPISAQIVQTLHPHAPALLAHLERRLDGMLDGRAALRLGALFHDVGKAQTASVEDDGRVRFLGHDKEGATITARRLRALRLSNEAVAHVRTTVAAHMRPLFLAQAFAQSERVSRRAAYRFFRDAGDAGLDVALLSLADHLATYDGAGPAQQWHALRSVVTRLLSYYFDKYEETIAPPPLLDGSELIAALNLRPGPQIGRLLRLLEEAQAAGEISSKAEALALARKQVRD